MILATLRAEVDGCIEALREFVPERRLKTFNTYVEGCMSGDTDAIQNLRFLVSEECPASKRNDEPMDCYWSFRHAVYRLNKAEREALGREPRKPVIMQDPTPEQREWENEIEQSEEEED